MNFKKFLKPDWRKIVVFLILSIISSFYTTPYFKVFGSYGLPLTYFTYVPESSFCDLEPCPKQGFNVFYQNLLIDIIFWYILSCLIVWIYDKVKKKK